MERIGAVYLKAPQIRAASVLLERISPNGELRTPQMQLIAGRRETLTLHTEDSVRYWIDPARVMFCSGNGTERMHFRQSVALGPDELVVDMFAGIGYFTIPLALSTGRHRPRRVVALEKNPDSAALLRRNAAENGVAEIVEVCEGDNREVGEAYVGRASRVVMGYIPTPVQFIARALAFLGPEAGGVIHYHFVATREESAALPLLHMQLEVAKTRFRLGAIAVRTVKDYAPQMYHFVADVQIEV
jgi:tRNA wybutosine-synthesizing protein 2